MPSLKHHVRAPKELLVKDWLEDFNLSINYHRIKHETRKCEAKKLKDENLILKAKVAQLTEELKSVNYHIKFRVMGYTPETIFKEL